MSNLVEIVLTISSVITALGIIAGFFWTIHKILNKPQESREDYMQYKTETNKRMDSFEEELKDIKQNQHLEAKCLLAILDTLIEQTNCDDKVRKTREELADHLVEKAF